MGLQYLRAFLASLDLKFPIKQKCQNLFTFSKGCRKSALALSDGSVNSVCSFQQQSDHLSQLELWELINSPAFKCVKSYVCVRSRIRHDHFNRLPRALGPYIWSDQVFMEQPEGVPKVWGRSRAGTQGSPPGLAQLLYSPVHIHRESPATASLKLQWETARMERAGNKAEQWPLQRSRPCSWDRSRTGTHGWGMLGSQDLRVSNRSSAEGNVFTFEVQCHFKIPSQEGQIKL